ncbi:hypothetical protein [uncultured Brevundimonas sp.]|uniref:hypothetical protein n=1 Tax=uncultured Brevundimonas sp. TaxID=213418 RepID=UPI002604C970|nr:hypothetical protein [uncultured Brevundimonas sp.]
MGVLKGADEPTQCCGGLTIGSGALDGRACFGVQRREVEAAMGNDPVEVGIALRHLLLEMLEIPAPARDVERRTARRRGRRCQAKDQG